MSSVQSGGLSACERNWGHAVPAGSRWELFPSIIDQQIDACGCFKHSEIMVASQEKGAVVNAGLSDERVAQTSPPAPRQHFCAEQARSLPVASCDLDQGQTGQACGHMGRQLGV